MKERNAMDKLLTLCNKCAEIYKDAYRTRPVPKTKTPKKEKCEHCGGRGDLRQYLVSPRKGVYQK